MSVCCCSLAGTPACYTCLNNPTFAYSPVKYVQVERTVDLARRLDDYFSPSKNAGKPQTNADRIRSMTDEELAKFINFHTFCEDCPAYGICNDPFAGDADACVKTIENWLRQEVE